MMADAGSGQRADSPGVIAFPPLLYVGTLALGLILHFFFPIHPMPALAARLPGAVLLVGGGALAKSGEITMRRAGTNVRRIACPQSPRCRPACLGDRGRSRA